jgi:hypothetical protein
MTTPIMAGIRYWFLCNSSASELSDEDVDIADGDPMMFELSVKLGSSGSLIFIVLESVLSSFLCNEKASQCCEI